MVEIVAIRVVGVVEEVWVWWVWVVVSDSTMIFGSLCFAGFYFLAASFLDLPTKTATSILLDISSFFIYKLKTSP